MDINKKIIRTRFAPSPTGDLHIGSIWMALFQWLYARHNGGKLIVRLEDTDQSRLVIGAESKIYEALKWYGLDYDEGPEIGGQYGPYRQSERLDLYKKYAEILLNKGIAYRCFCSAARLQKLREDQQKNHQPTGYDGLCRNLESNVVENRLKNESSVVRLKVPKSGQTTFNDIIRGDITFENSLIDDQVLLKSDGWPTYHLAGVVDDHLMEINTVIRGEEWLPSTPKQIFMYEAFGWELPKFAHAPLILGQDRSKLSKRHGSIKALAFRDEGYLPEAMINFLALLGWNPKTEEEIFDKDYLIKKFDLKDVNKSGAIFDQDKLKWFNAYYLRKLSGQKLLELCWPFIESNRLLTFNKNKYLTADNKEISKDTLIKTIEIVKDRLHTLADIVLHIKIFIFLGDYDTELLIWKKGTINDAKEKLMAINKFIKTLPEESFTEKELENCIINKINDDNLGVGDTLWPLRVALSGEKNSPSPFAIASVLGRASVLERINIALAKLESV